MGNKTLTRADLAETVHRDIGLSRAESAEMVNDVLELVSQALVNGTSVKLSSFGTFLVRSKRERMGRNPKTGEEVPILPRKVLVFRPSQVLRARVNGQDVPAEAE